MQCHMRKLPTERSRLKGRGGGNLKSSHLEQRKVLEQARAKAWARNRRRRAIYRCLHFSSFCPRSPCAGHTPGQKIPKEIRITESLSSRESMAFLPAAFRPTLCLVHSLKHLGREM